MTITRPMLAATVDSTTLEKIDWWPAYCSPKIDGIRCIIHPTMGPVTRSFKPLPNQFVRDELAELCGECSLDGELVAVDIQGRLLGFNQTQSALMSRGGQPVWEYWVFDCFGCPEDHFRDRIKTAKETLLIINDSRLKFIEHHLIRTPELFIQYAAKCAADGFEGAMLRHPEGPYKSGRSTLPQGWLLKYKEWADAEGTVIGFEELLRNTNPDERDNFDLAKRSSHVDGMIPMNTLGAIVLETEWGVLRVGSGFTMAQRQEIWERNLGHFEREKPHLGPGPDVGRKVTFKYQAFGMQDKPRFPIFKGFREDE